MKGIAVKSKFFYLDDTTVHCVTPEGRRGKRKRKSKNI